MAGLWCCKRSANKPTINHGLPGGFERRARGIDEGSCEAITWRDNDDSKITDFEAASHDNQNTGQLFRRGRVGPGSPVRRGPCGISAGQRPVARPGGGGVAVRGPPHLSGSPLGPTYGWQGLGRRQTKLFTLASGSGWLRSSAGPVPISGWLAVEWRGSRWQSVEKSRSRRGQAARYLLKAKRNNEKLRETKAEIGFLEPRISTLAALHELGRRGKDGTVVPARPAFGAALARGSSRRQARPTC